MLANRVDLNLCTDENKKTSFITDKVITERNIQFLLNSMADDVIKMLSVSSS